MATKWVYDARVKRYRNETTGRYIARATIVKMRDEFADKAKENIASLAGKLADKSLTVQAWETAMRAEIKSALGAQFMFGRGGLNAMTSADWGSVGALAKDSYGYLRKFAEDIAAGKLSEKQIAARAQLYFDTSRTAYERGRAASFAVRLPAYPADGGTECKANCRCRWEIAETATEVRATWKLNASAENCDGCVARAATYNPHVVTK